MKKNYLIYCESNFDGSEFELICKLNDKIIERRTEHCFEDILIESYNFFKLVTSKYEIDTRFDSLEIRIDYKY